VDKRFRQEVSLGRRIQERKALGSIGLFNLHHAGGVESKRGQGDATEKKAGGG